jgi:8-oxo-dGTP diphosphatase
MLSSQIQRPPKAKLEATADVVLLTMEDDELKVVLVERTLEPSKGSLALPGGFLWQDETAEMAARRVLAAKAGVAGDVFMEQLYTFTEPDRDTRGHIISVSYLALVRREDLVFYNGPQTEKPALYPVTSHPKLSFDHDRILKYGKKRVRDKLVYTNIAYALLPPLFTLTQLQRLYEIVLGQELDKRNFRKKFLSLGMIRPTDDTLTGGRHRPAQLYEFVNQTMIELSEPAART